MSNKLIISNQFQSQNRVNLLKISGVKTINETISPKNNNRIFGNVGVVHLQQNAQFYNENEDPNSPILPPDCPNCGGGITPPQPIVVRECNSNCNDYRSYFIVHNIVRLYYEVITPDEIQGLLMNWRTEYEEVQFPLYIDALNYMIEKNTEFTTAYSSEIQAMTNDLITYYNTDVNDTIRNVLKQEAYDYRYEQFNFQECYNIKVDNFGNVEETIKGYNPKIWNYEYKKIMKYSNYIEYEEILNGNRQVFNSGRTFANIRFKRMGDCSECLSSNSCN